MLVLICGDRNWTNRQAIARELSRFDPGGDVVMHGAARGADQLAGETARLMGFPVKSYPADWDKHGKAAGMIRNKLMLSQKPDIVLAFHSNLEESKGTKHMVQIAKAEGITTEIFRE